MTETCSRCYQDVDGRAVHDQGIAGCPACRHEHIVGQAAANADRYIARNPSAAQVLAEIQSRGLVA